ncbi:MAG: shikimate dehydrogenase [Candidatus Hydrogenedentes bacterium]|nr:shikimate dehydrogenase [Candidatus Hydrogenedentota bacterium]
MRDLRSISVTTQFCAVIGNPIAHSLSPAIHNAAYNALELDFVYVACQVEDVKSALGGMRALGNFRGMSVTIPHKIEAMKHVDEVAEVDRSIGSINTVVKEDGRLFGFGTDGPGALKALTDAGVDVNGRNVLMLGAGGAARAIAFTLARMTKPAALALLDINESLLKGLSADLRAGTPANIQAAPFTGETLAAAMKHADVIIHCTSVGMHPKEDATLVPPELFRPGQAVFDIVYTPLQTRLLIEAKERGLKVIPGIEMFVNQAVLQFERFTGEKAPVDVMRNVVLERLQS